MNQKKGMIRGDGISPRKRELPGYPVETGKDRAGLGH